MVSRGTASDAVNTEQTEPADLNFVLVAINGKNGSDRPDDNNPEFAQNLQWMSRFAEFVGQPDQAFLDFCSRSDRLLTLPAGTGTAEDVE